MKIIGHRGAAGLALENSHESILAALQFDLEAIEFDVHLTRDGELVVMHDRTTKRVSDEKVHIRKKTLQELKSLNLKNKQSIPTLDEVLKVIGGNNIIIDIKDYGISEKLPKILKRYPSIKFSFTSFKHDELRRVRKLLPNAPIYVCEHLNPIEIVYIAKSIGATGIALNKWLMNPLTYHLAGRYNLKIYVYTLNSPWLASFYKRFYPDVDICTDHPERFAERKSKSRTLKISKKIKSKKK